MIINYVKIIKFSIITVLYQVDGQTFANVNVIKGSFQEKTTDVCNILKSLLRHDEGVSLVIADGLFGLGKEAWDNEDCRWKENEYRDVMKFVKVGTKKKL